MDVVAADGRLHPVRVHGAPGPRDGARLAGGQSPDTAHLVEDDVAFRLRDHLIAATGVGQHGDLVALGPAGHEEGRLLAQHGRRLLLQAVHRRVFPVYIVSDLVFEHGEPQFRGRDRHRVAAQIDPFHPIVRSLEET